MMTMMMTMTMRRWLDCVNVNTVQYLHLLLAFVLPAAADDGYVDGHKAYCILL